MTYCVSGIHGCYQEFAQLLKEINFSEDDILYVLGDFIDRGHESLECIEFIRRTPNIIALMGNHEVLMLDFFLNPGDSTFQNWMSNGGHILMSQIEDISREDESHADKIINWMRALPLYLEVHVNGTDFFLSHAGIDMTESPENRDYSYVWSREEFFTNPGIEGKFHIFGHTPTPSIRKTNDCSIWYDDTHRDKICIDCGCVFGGRLAALRLDDMKVFYVKPKRALNQFK